MAMPPDEAAPTTTPAAAPAPPGGATGSPAQNPWTTMGGGRGSGGSRGAKRREKPGNNMGGTVSEDYGRLDEDDEQMLPTIAARTRGGVARRIDRIRHMLRGPSAPDAPGAAVTTDRESTPAAELTWPEHIAQLYDVGDGSDERVAEVLDAINITEGDLNSATIPDMHF